MPDLIPHGSLFRPFIDLGILQSLNMQHRSHVIDMYSYQKIQGPFQYQMPPTEMKDVILIKFCSLAALTTSSAASDENFSKQKHI